MVSIPRTWFLTRFGLVGMSGSCAQGTVDVYGYKVEQLAGIHFGKEFFRTASIAEHVVREGALVTDELIDSLLDSALADKLMHENVALLADSERAVGSLILDGGVPPSVEMDDV